MSVFDEKDIVRFKELIPKGREPYVATRIALAAQDDVYRQQHAILSLLDSNNEGTLKPPLTEALADAVEQVHDAFDDSPFWVDERTIVAARVVLNAAFEHGYRSDSPPAQPALGNQGPES